MTKKYIELEAAIETFEQAFDNNWEVSGTLDRIRAIPAADVVEVRHGRWNEVEHGENGVLCECTACKEWMLFYYGFDANYCPNCGAKMDGGQEDV